MVSGSPNPGIPAPTVLIGRAEVLRRAGLKKSTMYVLIRKGLFPQQVQKTNATVGWVEAEIEAWIQEREALRARPPAEKGAEILAKSPAKLTSPSVGALAWPEGTPAAGNLQTLNGEQIAQVLGRGSSRPKIVEPQYLYDSASGTLWVRVLKI